MGAKTSIFIVLTVPMKNILLLTFFVQHQTLSAFAVLLYTMINTFCTLRVSDWLVQSVENHPLGILSFETALI